MSTVAGTIPRITFPLHDWTTAMKNLSALRGLGLALLVAVAATGCGGSGDDPAPPPPPSAPPASVERDIQPSAIDPQVTEDRVHVAINPNPAVAPKGRLFIMLAGTRGVPDLYRYVLRSGASRGFHVIGLNYVNDQAVGEICAISSDAECFWNVRREVILGTDYSSEVAVAPPDAIVTRLNKALNYLNAQHPEEGWEKFLLGGSVDWSKVVIAGHSQGGGHAGVIAKLFSVDRAVYFASPADWDLRTDRPAGWEAAAGATPASRQWGFAHLQDSLVPWNQLSVIWQTMGLTSSAGAVSVDSSTSSTYSSSHTLTTNATPRNGAAADPDHGATVLDSVTPLKSDGTPLFDAVWAYLAFR